MIDLNEKPLCTIPRVMCWAVDNMELLLSQPDESIDLIYCDILYGTGRNFGDYQDLKPNRSEIEAHYLPRLKEMHRVLKSTGSIYLQMDWRISHWVRCIMDDIFGYGNFRNEIIWKYKTGGASKKYFPRKHDNILLYTKGKNYTFNKLLDKNYTKYKYGFSNLETKEDENGFYYLTTMSDVWEVPIIRTVKNKIDLESVGYATQKPKALIERLIKASSNEGDTVADYYLGSGTTAVVCKELNRNFIGCDINPKAIEITKARLNDG
jgi:site-specific DNA-methyltransferase (adenine-specific)